MKKLKLEVDGLVVETFTTEDTDIEKGTVDAFEGRTITLVCGTCELSCEFTPCFDYTCDHTCACE